VALNSTLRSSGTLKLTVDMAYSGFWRGC